MCVKIVRHRLQRSLFAADLLVPGSTFKGRPRRSEAEGLDFRRTSWGSARHELL